MWYDAKGLPILQTKMPKINFASVIPAVRKSSSFVSCNSELQSLGMHLRNFPRQFSNRNWWSDLYILPEYRIWYNKERLLLKQRNFRLKRMEKPCVQNCCFGIFGRLSIIFHYETSVDIRLKRCNPYRNTKIFHLRPFHLCILCTCRCYKQTSWTRHWSRLRPSNIILIDFSLRFLTDYFYQIDDAW